MPANGSTSVKAVMPYLNPSKVIVAFIVLMELCLALLYNKTNRAALDSVVQNRVNQYNNQVLGE